MTPEDLIVVTAQVRKHLESTYGRLAPVNQRLYYHNLRHTDWGMDRVQQIMTMLTAYHPGIESRHNELALIAILFHDYHQPSYIDWTTRNPPLRRRRPGLPERLSADEAVSWMHRTGRFTQSEIEEVEFSILATEPRWSEEYRTVIHPKLEPDSPLIARVVTLADVNGSGLDHESDVVIEDSLRLLLENTPGFPVNQREVGWIKKSEQQDYLTVVRDWLNSQQDFVIGRKQLLDNETQPFGPASQQVKSIFSQFDNNLTYLKWLNEAIKDLNLTETVEHLRLWKYC